MLSVRFATGNRNRNWFWNLSSLRYAKEPPVRPNDSRIINGKLNLPSRVITPESESKSNTDSFTCSIFPQGYTDEPIGKILDNIGNSDTVLLDRWNLKVEPNPSVQNADPGKDNLPLNVVNNYFSLGVDAHIALEFHEARGESCLNFHACDSISILWFLVFD